MASTQKVSYVSDLYQKLEENPHVILVGFGSTKHKQLEDFRKNLRKDGENPTFIVLRNALFRKAFDSFNRKHKVLSQEQSEAMQENAKGQVAVLMTAGDWSAALKKLKEFAKEDESVMMKVGLLEGVLYEGGSLKKLADLPSKEQLIAKILGTLKAPHSRFVYSLQFNTMKLVNVIKNAAEKTN